MWIGKKVQVFLLDVNTGRYSNNNISSRFQYVYTDFCLVLDSALVILRFSDSTLYLVDDLCILHLEQCILSCCLCEVLPGYEICTIDVMILLYW